MKRREGLEEGYMQGESTMCCHFKAAFSYYGLPSRWNWKRCCYPVNKAVPFGQRPFKMLELLQTSKVFITINSLLHYSMYLSCLFPQVVGIIQHIQHESILQEPFDEANEGLY